jgi:hypothetical protein
MPSSVIDDFRYVAESNELTIRFKSGRTYVYRLVPEGVPAAFAAARSKVRSSTPGSAIATRSRNSPGLRYIPLRSVTFTVMAGLVPAIPLPGTDERADWLALGLDSRCRGNERQLVHARSSSRKAGTQTFCHCDERKRTPVWIAAT